MKKNKTYDISKDNCFSATVELGPDNAKTVRFDIEKPECGENLTYDEVESRAYGEIEKLYPYEFYPKSELKKLEIYCSESDEWCEVLSESDEKRIKELTSDGKNRILILPDATYSLTPECKLWMELKDSGILDEDSEFDYGKMKNILNKIK